MWLDRSLARARRSLTALNSWPKDLLETLGGSTRGLYLTPEQAGELYTELRKTLERLDRYRERRDPNKRPADALPIEFILLGYPVLDLPPLPAADARADGDTDDHTTADGLIPPDRRPAGSGENVRPHRRPAGSGENVRPPRHNGQTE